MLDAEEACVATDEPVEAVLAAADVTAPAEDGVAADAADAAITTEVAAEEEPLDAADALALSAWDELASTDDANEEPTCADDDDAPDEGTDVPVEVAWLLDDEPSTPCEPEDVTPPPDEANAVPPCGRTG